MKRILIGAAIFVLGLVIGGGVMGFVVKRVYQKQMAQIYAMSVGADALLAQQLRGGLAQIVLEGTDRRLIQGVIEIHQNEQLKDLWSTDVSLKAAKEYYVCSKLEFPAEIAQIMNDLPPVDESRCSLPE